MPQFTLTITALFETRVEFGRGTRTPKRGRPTPSTGRRDCSRKMARAIHLSREGVHWRPAHGYSSIRTVQTPFLQTTSHQENAAVLGCQPSHRNPESYFKLCSHQTALHVGVITGNREIVECLINAHASPDVQDRNGNSCCHLAVCYAPPACLTALIRARNKPDLNVHNYDGESAGPLF